MLFAILNPQPDTVKECMFAIRVGLTHTECVSVFGEHMLGLKSLILAGV